MLQEDSQLTMQLPPQPCIVHFSIVIFYMYVVENKITQRFNLLVSEGTVMCHHINDAKDCLMLNNRHIPGGICSAECNATGDFTNKNNLNEK